MPMPKMSEIRSLSPAEISAEILSVKKELFELRLQQATRQLTKPHQIKLAKHRLGQLLTAETEIKQSTSPVQE